MTALPADLVIGFDIRDSGEYVTAECQLGAHHACPGGFRNEAKVLELPCRCSETGCACVAKGVRGGCRA